MGMVCWCAMGGGCGEDVPKLAAAPNRKDGTAVYILLDVSGSMDQPVANAGGAAEPKLAIAKRAAIGACQAIAKYAAEDQARTIRVAVASFSDDYVVASAMDKPNVEAITREINKLKTRGGTAIGDAVIAAQKALDQTGLKSQHILVVTDGENNQGLTPEGAAAAINGLPAELRPAVYVVAFDVKASVFDGVKGKGWQVFSAADGRQLAQQLDEVVGGKILIEK